MKRIGMLTSGGDCQALNAAMRGVAKTLFITPPALHYTRFIGNIQEGGHTL